jgi:hypothetical protein
MGKTQKITIGVDIPIKKTARRMLLNLSRKSDGAQRTHARATVSGHLMFPYETKELSIATGLSMSSDPLITLNTKFFV